MPLSPGLVLSAVIGMEGAHAEFRGIPTRHDAALLTITTEYSLPTNNPVNSQSIDELNQIRRSQISSLAPESQELLLSLRVS